MIVYFRLATAWLFCTFATNAWGIGANLPSDCDEGLTTLIENAHEEIRASSPLLPLEHQRELARREGRLRWLKLQEVESFKKAYAISELVGLTQHKLLEEAKEIDPESSEEEQVARAKQIADRMFEDLSRLLNNIPPPALTKSAPDPELLKLYQEQKALLKKLDNLFKDEIGSEEHRELISQYRDTSNRFQDLAAQRGADLSLEAKLLELNLRKNYLRGRKKEASPEEREQYITSLKELDQEIARVENLMLTPKQVNPRASPHDSHQETAQKLRNLLGGWSDNTKWTRDFLHSNSRLFASAATAELNRNQIMRELARIIPPDRVMSSATPKELAEAQKRATDTLASEFDLKAAETRAFKKRPGPPSTQRVLKAGALEKAEHLQTLEDVPASIKKMLADNTKFYRDFPTLTVSEAFINLVQLVEQTRRLAKQQNH